MQDEAEVFCRRVWEAGLKDGEGDGENVVVFEGFVGMPHCFRFVFFSFIFHPALYPPFSQIEIGN